MWLGEWYNDDKITFTVCTHSISTGGGIDADSAPSYRVYEDNTSTPILTGNMSLFDGANTTGFYCAQIDLANDADFQFGKTYNIYIYAPVSGVTGTVCYTFKIYSQAQHRVRDASLRIVPGTVDDTIMQPTTTQFAASDISLHDNDHYKYRIVMFTSGALVDQVRDVTAYTVDGDYGIFTCSAFTDAPSSGDTFILI